MFYRKYHKISISLKKTELIGELIIPIHAKSIVIFVNVNKLTYKNHLIISRSLHKQKIGTLFLDLLNGEENLDVNNKIDNLKITNQLISATKWLKYQEADKIITIGYFASGYGVSIALKAADYLPQIGAIVTFNGHSESVLDNVSEIKCPVLLITQQNEIELVKTNKIAFEKMQCDKKIELIEDNILDIENVFEEVNKLSSKWFENNLTPVLV